MRYIAACSCICVLQLFVAALGRVAQGKTHVDGAPIETGAVPIFRRGAEIFHGKVQKPRRFPFVRRNPVTVIAIIQFA